MNVSNIPASFVKVVTFGTNEHQQGAARKKATVGNWIVMLFIIPIIWIESLFIELKWLIGEFVLIFCLNWVVVESVQSSGISGIWEAYFGICLYRFRRLNKLPSKYHNVLYAVLIAFTGTNIFLLSVVANVPHEYHWITLTAGYIIHDLLVA